MDKDFRTLDGYIQEAVRIMQEFSQRLKQGPILDHLEKCKEKLIHLRKRVKNTWCNSPQSVPYKFKVSGLILLCQRDVEACIKLVVTNDKKYMAEADKTIKDMQEAIATLA